MNRDNLRVILLNRPFKRGLTAFTAFLVLAALIFTYPPPFPASAAPALPAALRIGLESRWANVDSVAIDSSSLAVGYGIGEGGAAGGNVSAVIARASEFRFIPASGPFVRKNFAQSYADAVSLANSAAYGLNAAPALDSDGSWAVYVFGYASEAAARADADSGGGTFLAGNARRVMLMDGSACAAVFENSGGFCRAADARGGETSLDERRYRGAIELTRSGDKLTAVNVISLQDYLKSAVPSEMPSSWNPEALQAQAVACRNYALNHLGAHGSQGYNLCDKVHCQNYLGSGNEAASAAAAVDATDGYLIYYGGEVIDAVFFSSSGGVTEDSENVWANAVPYLRGVADPNEYEPKEWVRSFTYDELTGLAQANGLSVGKVTGVSAAAEPSGRVAALTLSGTGGVKTLVKEEIRSFFNSSDGGMLESRNFTVKSGSGPDAGAALYAQSAGGIVPVSFPGLYAIGKDGLQRIDSAAAIDAGGFITALSAFRSAPAGDAVTFTGRGWGHGVGMSQRGAQGLAGLGYDFIRILEYYYTGVTVRR